MVMQAKMMGREALMGKLNRLVPEAEAQLAQAQLEVAKEGAARIAARAPVGETGEYRDSFEGARLADRPGDVAAVKTTDRNATGIFAAWFWRFIEFGTAPHVIKAKNAPALRFKGKDGGLVSVQSVNHPGTSAKPHIFPTWRAFKKTARRKMANAVNKAVRKAMGK